MRETRGPELPVLRQQLTADQRAILNTLWEHYRDQNQWILRRVLHQRFGRPAVRRHLEGLGESVIRGLQDGGRDYYRLTFLGVLLTDQGEESEQLLVRYLEYIRGRCKADPSLEWVGSQEVEAALGLTPERSRLLRQLVRLSHWWGGGSGFGDREWTVGVPVDVEDLPPETELRAYVREHVLRHFPLERPPEATETARGEFWFISDPNLRRQMVMDWHEAQDVLQVRGWKSCVILCGGILEALLLDALARGGSPAGEPARSDLSALVDAAGDRGILSSTAPPLSRALREFRRLTDPGRQARDRIEVTRDEAEAALIAIRTCLQQMAAISAPHAPQT